MVYFHASGNSARQVLLELPEIVAEAEAEGSGDFGRAVAAILGLGCTNPSGTS